MGRERWNDHDPVEHPGIATPGAVWFFSRILYPLVRVFHRATLEGTENLPDHGPYLLVSNHPPSIGGGEFNSMMALWARAFGTTRPLAAFVLSLSFEWWPISRLFPLIGAIPSTYAAAEDALAKRVPVVIFPGGDYEAFRPFWQSGRPDLGAREGFLRIAKKARVPIVPMGIRGNSSPILFKARVLAYLFVWPRIFGLKRFGVSVLGAIGTALIIQYVPLPLPWRILIAWLWMASPLSLLPWFPTKSEFALASPSRPSPLRAWKKRLPSS